MGATVTEKRFTTKPRFRSYAIKRVIDGSISTRSYDLWSSGQEPTFVPALQTTTSFRSGVRAQNSLDPDTTFKVENVLDSISTNSNEEEDPYIALKRFRSSTPQSLVSSYDTGHPFRTEKAVHTFGEDITLASASANWYYRGPLVICLGQLGTNHIRGWSEVPTDNELQLTDLNKFGQKAISQTLPTLPVSGISTFLGEAHEGLPRLLGHSSLFERQGRAYNSLGSEYLNVQFGWVPFISDVRKFLKAFRNAGKILSQYQRDSGKMVRRKWSLPANYTVLDSLTTTLGNTNLTPGNLRPLSYTDGFDSSNSEGVRSAIQPGSVQVLATRTQKEHLWFSGAYSYLLAEDDSFFGRMERYSQLADKLLGVRITPSVLWELTPWSWLLDWETNIGVNINNATALGQDNLVLRYGYVMRSLDVKTSQHIPHLPSYSGYTGRVFNSCHYTRKERIRGTPFGFGLNTSLFSEKQWAILGALGMTKAPKQLF